MVEVLDERGRVFGLVNIIDLLVVLLVSSTLVAGLALVTSDDTEDEPLQPPEEQIILDVTVQHLEPYIVDAIPAPGTTDDSTLRIVDVSTTPARIITNDSTGTPHVHDHPWRQTVDIRVEVSASRDGDTLQYNGNRLVVGTHVTLDLGTVVLQGDVTNITSPS